MDLPPDVRAQNQELNRQRVHWFDVRLSLVNSAWFTKLIFSEWSGKGLQEVGAFAFSASAIECPRYDSGDRGWRGPRPWRPSSTAMSLRKA